LYTSATAYFVYVAWEAFYIYTRELAITVSMAKMGLIGHVPHAQDNTVPLSHAILVMLYQECIRKSTQLLYVSIALIHVFCDGGVTARSTCRYQINALKSTILFKLCS
jgi:hypothetical protein